MDFIVTNLLNVRDPAVFDFQTGYLAGVVIALLAIATLLLLKIIILLFFSYPRRAQGIVIKEDDGDIFITSSAVIGLVHLAEKELPPIKLEKIKLFQKKKNYSMLLNISFDSNSASLPEIKDKIKDKIRQKLRETFGIDTLDEIKIKVLKTYSSASGARIQSDQPEA